MGCGGERLSLTYDDSVATNSEYVVAGDHVGGVTSTFFFARGLGKKGLLGRRSNAVARDCLGMYRRVMRRFVQQESGFFYYHFIFVRFHLPCFSGGGGVGLRRRDCSPWVSIVQCTLPAAGIYMLQHPGYKQETRRNWPNPRLGRSSN